MEYRRKVLLFSALAGVCAAIAAPLAAAPTTRHIFIVLPLVGMGIFLFLAGFYAGRYRGSI